MAVEEPGKGVIDLRTLGGESASWCEFRLDLGGGRGAVQGAVIRAWMDERVLPTFSGRVLPIDTGVARRCAKLHIPVPRPVDLEVIFRRQWLQV